VRHGSEETDSVLVNGYCMVLVRYDASIRWLQVQYMCT
jgi:hypothetical protein